MKTYKAHSYPRTDSRLLQGSGVDAAARSSGTSKVLLRRIWPTGQPASALKPAVIDTQGSPITTPFIPTAISPAKARLSATSADDDLICRPSASAPGRMTTSVVQQLSPRYEQRHSTLSCVGNGSATGGWKTLDYRCREKAEAAGQQVERKSEEKQGLAAEVLSTGPPQDG